MTIGSLLDGVFRIYFGNFALLLGIVAATYVPVYALQLIGMAVFRLGLGFGGAAPSGETGAVVVGFLIAGILLNLVLTFVAYCLAQGAATYAISERYLGRPVGIADAYRAAWQRFGTLLNTTLTVGLRVFLGLLLLIIPGIFLMLVYAVAIPVVMVEGGKTRLSLRRSAELTQGFRWKVLGVIVVVWLLSAAVAIMASMISGPLTMVFGSAMWPVSHVISSLAELVAFPVAIVAGILLYYDFRIRKEGFDLEMLSQAMGPSGETGEPESRPI